MQCNANHNYKKEKGGLEAIKKNQIAMSLKTQKNIGIDSNLFHTCKTSYILLQLMQIFQIVLYIMAQIKISLCKDKYFFLVFSRLSVYKRLSWDN